MGGGGEAGVGGGGESTRGAGGGCGTTVGAAVGADTGAVAKHLAQVVWQYPSGASAVGMVMKAAWQLPLILCSVSPTNVEWAVRRPFQVLALSRLLMYAMLCMQVRIGESHRLW